MTQKSGSSLLALQIGSIFALLVGCGILIAIILGKSDLPITMPMMLVVAGLGLSVAAAAQSKKVPPEQ